MTPALRTDTLPLVALPSAVSISRAYCKATLQHWGHKDEDFVSDSALIVSELITNAVQATNAAGPIRLGTRLNRKALIRLSFADTGDHLSIEVWDGCPYPPESRAKVPIDSTDGRGLQIVASLAQHWGFRYPRNDPRIGGKIVFAVLPIPPVTPPIKALKIPQSIRQQEIRAIQHRT